MKKQKKQSPHLPSNNVKEGFDNRTRLNKFIANAGVCSRREADKLIASGDIKVNDKTIVEMGYKLHQNDKVYYKDRQLYGERYQYILLNKPKGFITTTSDPKNRRTVMELVAKSCEERIYPVGRLDRDTTGLLLFTNDGELAEKLAHPGYSVKKIYKIVIDKPLTKSDFDQIVLGVILEDGKALVNNLAILDNRKTLGMEISMGKNRIVRRIFEYLGYEVIKLDRVVYAGLDKSNLPRGKWRQLTKQEILEFNKIKKKRLKHQKPNLQ